MFTSAQAHAGPQSAGGRPASLQTDWLPETATRRVPAGPGLPGEFRQVGLARLPSPQRSLTLLIRAD